MGKEELPDLLPGGSGSQRGAASFSVSSIESPSVTAYCWRCSARVSKELSFRCVAVLAVSLFLLVSGIFWIIHPSSHRHAVEISYDASDSMKLEASVHAGFQLQKRVSDLRLQIRRLEYDIFSEFDLPNTKVVILSMRQADTPNVTNVVFGVLPDPLNSSISEVSLSVLRSSMVDVFLKESNLTLTNATFGQLSNFEILKFPGGITVIPDLYSIWQIPRVFFNFTLNNSVSEILDYLSEFKVELKRGLLLNPYEAVFVQITSANGSTIDSPVVVQASVVSNYGKLLPQRLRQLAETIRKSPEKNLGLDHSLFGKVKSVVLSSYLQGTLDASAPVSLPAPSPYSGNHAWPPSHPHLSPETSPHHHVENHYRGHQRSLPPSYSPHSLPSTTHSPCPHFHSASRSKPSSRLPLSHPPRSSPSPGVYVSSNPGSGASMHSVAPSPVATSSAMFSARKMKWETSLCCVSAAIVCLLRRWQ